MAATSFGAQRLAPGATLARHRHVVSYAAVVLAGSYVEAGDEGRRRVAPGDVLVHRAFEAHTDRIHRRGAEVLNLVLPDAHGLPAGAQVRDADALVRAAERDPSWAAALLVLSAVPGAPARSDWPDLLAAALSAPAPVRLDAWAAEHRLAPSSVSRGFRLVYGTTPRRFRAELRARRALHEIVGGAEPLGRIAYACGFADQAHLTRAVRALTGAPPSAWRRAVSSPFKLRTGGRG